MHGKSWRWPVSVVAAVKLGLRLERPGFDSSIETIRCIRPLRMILTLTGPMLRDKMGRSYKRKTGKKERQYIYFYVFSLY